MHNSLKDNKMYEYKGDRTVEGFSAFASGGYTARISPADRPEYVLLYDVGVDLCDYSIDMQSKEDSELSSILSLDVPDVADSSSSLWAFMLGVLVLLPLLALCCYRGASIPVGKSKV
jgi:hypothetical protein